MLQYTPTTPQVRDAAGPDGPAADRQVLLHGPRARAQLRRARGQPRAAVLHDQLAQPRPRAARTGTSTPTPRRSCARSTSSARSPAATTSTCSGSAPAASSRRRCSATSRRAATSACAPRASASRCWTSTIPAPIGMFALPPLHVARAARSRRAGVLDGVAWRRSFTWLRPNDLVWNYWVNNYLTGQRPAGVRHPRLERRLDEPARRAARAVPRHLQHNLLAQPGAFEVLGTPVDLGADQGRHLRHRRDDRPPHAVEGAATARPSCSAADSTFVLSNAGHIAEPRQPAGQPEGALLRRPRARAATPTSGARPPSSAGHVVGALGRLGHSSAPATSARRRARLGSRRHPPLEPAPGRVRARPRAGGCVSRRRVALGAGPERRPGGATSRASCAWLERERGRASPATTSCGAGRSSDARGFLVRGLGASTASPRPRPTRRCSRDRACRARAGSRARSSTTPSTCSRARRTTRPAIVALGEDGDAGRDVGAELRGQVGAFAATLRELGVGPATASPPTCRTSPRRSSRCSRPRASARSGPRARRTSARRA